MKAVVFDMDGVIFDSERFVIEMWKLVAQKHGLRDIEQTCMKCLGINATVSRQIFLEQYGETFPYDEYHKEMARFFMEHSAGGRLRQKTGVKELLSWLKEQDIRVGLASSTPQKAVYLELTEGGLLPYFDQIVCGNMVKKSKPEPDIFLEACRRLETAPGDTFAVEDSYNGIRAASRAGMRPIMVPDLMPPDEEMERLAERVFPSLLEVKAYFSDIQKGTPSFDTEA